MLAFGVSELALAQTQVQQQVQTTATNNWVGISSGYPLGGVLHFGIDNMWNEADLRLNLAAASASSGSGFSSFFIYGGADLLFDIKPLPHDLSIYAGGGLLLGILLSDAANAFGINARGIGGLKWRPIQEISVYLEPQLALGGTTNNLGLNVNVALGLSYHF